MKVFGMCINKRVVAGLAAVGVGVWVFAPEALSAALPLLVLAICPLSMVLMMKAMSGMNGQQNKQQPLAPPAPGTTATVTTTADVAPAPPTVTMTDDGAEPSVHAAPVASREDRGGA